MTCIPSQSYKESKLKVLSVCCWKMLKILALCVKHEFKDTQDTTYVFCANWKMLKVSPVHELKDAIIVNFVC